MTCKPILGRYLECGDGIILSGAVVYLLQRGLHGIIFPCRMHDLATFRDVFSLFSPVLVEIHETPESIRTASPELLKTGWFGEGEDMLQRSDESFDQWWYRQLGIDFRHKWDSCPIWDAYQSGKLTDLSTEEGTIFIHDDVKHESVTRPESLGIDRSRPEVGVGRVLVPDRSVGTGSILRWIPALLSAREIHLIDSAFLNLCEALPLDPCIPKFIHHYARPPQPCGGVTTRHNWTILK